MDEEAPSISAGDVAATVGTILLVGVAVLAVYTVGGVLIYGGLIQPGMPTVVAAVFVLAVASLTYWAGRELRLRGATRRRTLAACAGIVLVLSILFFPFAAIFMVM
jgi:hypothetical protein